MSQPQLVRYPPAVRDPSRPVNYDEFYGDDLMKQWLQKLPDPKPMRPDLKEAHDASCARDSAALKIRIAELEARKRSATSVANLNELNKAISEAKFKRNLQLWRIFPINSMPPEILTVILRFAVKGLEARAGVIERLCISRVCRLWREVALADGTLWNLIFFRDKPPYRRSLSWFDRAGTAPLEIHIDERDSKWDGDEERHRFTGQHMAALMDKLLTKVSQIRTLILVVDTWAPMLVALHKFQSVGPPSAIRRLELHRSGLSYVRLGAGFQPGLLREPLRLFSGPTPLLNYVCLNGVHIDWDRSQLQNLTFLDLRRMAMEVMPKVERLREILASSPNLETLILDGAGPLWDVDHPPFAHRVQLPKLKKFTIGDCTVEYACYIVEQFEAPALQALTLMSLNGEDYAPLIEAITPRFPAIRLATLYSLEVVDNPANRSLLARWFLSMPELKYLRISQLQPHFFRVLLEDPRAHGAGVGPNGQPSPFREVICPKLDRMEYQYIATAHVVTFIQGRKRLGVPIQRLYIQQEWMKRISQNEMGHIIQEMGSQLMIIPPGKIPDIDEPLDLAQLHRHLINNA